jgi:hypothetical protein
MHERFDGKPSSDRTLRLWKQEGWDYVVRCYYVDHLTRSEDGSFGKRPGELAIETRHKGESSKDMEVAAGESRSDIGRVVVIPL